MECSNGRPSMHHRLTTAVLAVSVAFWSASADDPTADEMKNWEGEWREISFEYEGKKWAKGDAGFKAAPMIVKANELTMNGRRKTFKLNPAKSPKEIDLTSHDGVETGQIHLGIYKLEKNQLTICMPFFATGARPTEFKRDADNGMTLMVFERVNPK